MANYFQQFVVAPGAEAKLCAVNPGFADGWHLVDPFGDMLQLSQKQIFHKALPTPLPGA